MKDKYIWTKKPAIKNRQASVVFTWDLFKTVQLATEGKLDKIGGPAVKLLPHIVPEKYRDISNAGDWLSIHNPSATRTSIGCIRKCNFCVVHKIEPEFKEIDNFIPKPILCDNNFLACSKEHIVRSIDKLSTIKGIDFNQGLDARLFKSWHVDEFKKLNWEMIRFAWDSSDQESYVFSAIEKLKKAGFPTRKIRCYVLIGFNETQDEATYRCKILRDQDIFPNPMRYQPWDTLEKDSYCPPQWNETMLKRFCRYWWKTTWLKNLPFEEFLNHYQDEAHFSSSKQMSLKDLS